MAFAPVDPQADKITCGRVGTNGRELVEVFATEIEASEALEALAKAKRRQGYRDLRTSRKPRWPTDYRRNCHDNVQAR